MRFLFVPLILLKKNDRKYILDYNFLSGNYADYYRNHIVFVFYMYFVHKLNVSIKHGCCEERDTHQEGHHDGFNTLLAYSLQTN